MRVTSNSTLMIGKGEYAIPGTPVEINDDEAKDLIARGLVTKAGKAEAKPAEKPKPAADSKGESGDSKGLQ